uniref:Uncharacterized protein n=1 Tax=Glossina brevipalpis TaxID=37001 RepID=A0A1A9WC69_9MUSC
MNWPTVRLQWRCCWWQFTSLTIFMLSILMSCISDGSKSIANAQVKVSIARGDDKQVELSSFLLFYALVYKSGSPGETKRIFSLSFKARKFGLNAIIMKGDANPATSHHPKCLNTLKQILEISRIFKTPNLQAFQSLKHKIFMIFTSIDDKP